MLSPNNMEPVVEENQQEPRDLILMAALKLFAEKGFFNTSLPEIAKAAGLTSVNAVYQHFKTKQAIASQLYADVLESLSSSIDDIRQKNAKSPEQLRGVVDLLFQLVEDAPDIMRLLFVIDMKEILPDEKALAETAAFLKIRKIFQVGVKSGDMRNLDPMLLYTYFFGIINHSLTLILAGVLDKNIESYQVPVWLAAWSTVAKK